MVIWNTQSQSKILALHIVVASLVLLLVIYAAVVLKRVSVEFAAFRYQDAKLTVDLAHLDTILSDSKKYEGDIASVSASLPTSYKGTAQFMSHLESIANSAGVTIADTQLDATPAIEGQRATIKVSQKLQTNFSSLQTYLHEVSRMPYHTQLVELSINSGVTTVVQNVYIQ